MNSFLYNTLSKYFDGFTKKQKNHGSDTLNVICLDHNKESIEYQDNYLLSKEVDLTKRHNAKGFLTDFKQKFMMLSYIYGFTMYGSLIKSVMMKEKKSKKSTSFNYNFV